MKRIIKIMLRHKTKRLSTLYRFIAGRSVLLMLTLLLCSSTLMAQSKIEVNGTIADEYGDPLIGASVSEKGTTNGVTTNIDGLYKLSVPTDAILVITYVGFDTQEIQIKGKTNINVVLKEDRKMLDEVVVTALGIKREKKSLGYALQEVKGESLLAARDPNVANSLAGKIAGLDVRSSPSGAGGSSRIVLRGNSSIGGSNQPLIVVDGVPIDGGTGSDNDDFYGENLVDRGSGMADISPDDIESMSILKGPAAAALYGSRAGNGVIMITTKTGQGVKGIGVTYSTNLTFDKPMTKPRYQNKYGQGISGRYDNTKEGGYGSWGALMEGQTVTDYVGRNVLYAPGGNNINDFLDTGTTWTNSLGVTASDDKRSVRLGITHTDNKGIVPNNKFKRTAATLRATAKLTDKLSIDAKASFIHQEASNRIKLGANHDNIFKQFLVMPRSIQLKDLVVGNEGYHASYKGIVNPYAFKDGTAHGITDLSGRPVSYVIPASGNTANPYFSAYNNVNNDRKNRFIGLASAKYEFTEWLSIQGRYGIDYTSSSYKDIQSTGTIFTSYKDVNGNIMMNKDDSYEMNTDFLLTFNKSFLDSKLGVVATAGGNMMYARADGMYATANGLEYEYYYTLANAKKAQASNSMYRKKINSVYGTASVSWDNAYYLDLTARNDWSSALNSSNRSYFYPSVGASWLFSETFRDKLGPIQFGKLRLSWAQVGNDTDAYRLHNYNTVILGNSSPSTVEANYDLKNETVDSYEIGLELSALNGRVGLDFAFYNKDSKDQIISIPTSETGGYYGKWINAGKIRNRGVELLLTGIPVQTKDFEWNVALNYSKNKNEIISLYDNVKEYQLSHSSYATQVRIVAEVGGQFGDIKGQRFLRDDAGNLILDAQGLPQTNGEYEKLGNASPKWMAGLNNSFRYKDFDLAFQLDIRYGGKVYMGSLRQGAESGTLDFTEANRADGSMLIHGVKQDGTVNNIATNAQEFWGRVAGGNGPAEPWIKDATNLRLRELSVGYSLPKSLLNKTFLRSAKISFVGRNLWMIHSKVKGFDPEAGFSTGNAQGFEYGSMPTLRTLGFNVNVTF